MSLQNILAAANSPKLVRIISTVESVLKPLNKSGDTARAPVSATEKGRGERKFAENTVFLNLYDLTEANDVLYHAGIGLHHTGVEVYGMEFAFGRCDEGSGVFEVAPRYSPPHIFREQLVLGETQLSQQEVLNLVKEFKENDRQWSGRAYHLVQNNCNHFSEAFAMRLLPPEVRAEQQRQGNLRVYDDGEREVVELSNGKTAILPPLMPRWINRLARNASRFMPSKLVERIDAMDRGGGGGGGVAE
ncbi:hypothetical protein C3747_161g45 [Trypanosoma cruzi]|uniref:PPPDE domain-containing protein n=2 Tax=Trypanosoma cruzi TaxID=5693 RepID=Q4DWL2_TRYCC|nr:hypothetical protein, conserved [Trypanosoma cruzi]EAN96894.1 hypothetical protein, conserved [Trypanosoma cruzi]KAF8303777.1 putative PPPDE putative peptidase domain containing protein [Trypanosoma cruzi]PWV04130.1 hypothetical protein C3747_161g45 [Trypanosoma cruzi]RNC56873.1 hypothetical protein TcCL_ESM05580 [Trypanosoma cruzi]|eukprot:XP_818745.1 hypothetical protein [Trypanosoma cruzi strain CL Brener]